MGMGIGRHRAIDAVEPVDFGLTVRQLGLMRGQVRDGIAEMAELVVPSMMECTHVLKFECGGEDVTFAGHLVADCKQRIQVALCAATQG